MVRVPRLAGLFLRIALVSTLALAFPRAASAQIVSGSDGSDGAFTFVPDTPGGSTMTIDLALAASGLDGQGQPITWQTPSPVAGRGVYDPFAWAVVFKYTSVIVPSGKTVQFANRGGRPPVVWLASDSVFISGTVSLDGETSSVQPQTWLEPGPGGFRAGLRSAKGFGIGGAAGLQGRGNFGVDGTTWPSGRAYGSPSLFPLIGGSGSALGGTSNNWDGGPGGGAILIAASSRIDVTGSIRAQGGFANGTSIRGSGGGIRLVANVVAKTLAATVTASGGASYLDGRIRFEGLTFEGPIMMNVTPAPMLSMVPGPLLPDATTAMVRVSSILLGTQSLSVPADPQSSFVMQQADVVCTGSGSATLTIEARNVALGRTCWVRVADVYGAVTAYNSTPLTGTTALSTATVSVPLTIGIHAIQVQVVL